MKGYSLLGKERNWTSEQKKAIDSRAGDILVSAAAGSGKTAVLTQRLVDILLDENNPCMADEILVVTFTKAAASEIKRRVESKIDEILSKEPHNARLKIQKSLIKTADISTIHSFCGKLTKENFYFLDLPPKIKMADELELSLLKKQAIETVLSRKYKDENNKNFLKMMRVFSSEKDDTRFIKIINTLYEFLMAHPFPKKWLEQKSSFYNENTEIRENVFFKIIKDYSITCLDFCSLLYEDMLHSLEQDEEIKDTFKDFLASEYNQIDNLKKSLHKENFKEIVNSFFSVSFSVLKRFPKEYSNDFFKEKIKNNRNKVKEITSELKEIFNLCEEDYLEDTVKIKKVVSELFLVVKDYIDEFSSLKRKRRICDFSDLEHYALRLLVSGTAEGLKKTDIAYNLEKKYKYIMVDECQDINEIQNTIFNSVSKNGENLFMVGDVKQSIYRFRQAMPEIFLRKKENSEIYKTGKKRKTSKIILDRNFRSKKGILDFINFIFKNILTKYVGEIDYTTEEELVYGSDYLNNTDTDVELKILDLKECENKDMNITEADYISRLVKTIIKSNYMVKDGNNYRPASYKDFCILLRNANSHTEQFKNVLDSNGIPVKTYFKKDLLESEEIVDVLSLLQTIDNPYNDISLASAMLSPVFGFSLDDIAFFKEFGKDIPLYNCVKLSAKNGNETAINFIERLKEYQKLSKILNISNFLDYLFETAGLVCIYSASDESEKKIDNLNLLIALAEDYENEQKSDFSSFVRYLILLKEHGIKLNDSSFFYEDSLDAVSIMSIHHSKGLEFPICILANCSRKFNKDCDDVILHSNLGVGIKLLDELKNIKYTTFQREAIKQAILKSSVSEELRVLYVALTRARQRLILLSSFKDANSFLKKLALAVSSFPSGKLPPFFVLKAQSYSELICACILKSNFAGKLLEKVEISSELDNSEKINNFSIEHVKINRSRCEEEQREKGLKRKYSTIQCSYSAEDMLSKFQNLTIKKSHNVPTKCSVTQILNLYQNKQSHDKERLLPPLSNYLLSKSENDLNKKKSMLEKGSDLHKLIKVIDFNEASKNFDKHIEYLVGKNILDLEAIKKINLELVKKFLRSSLVKRILKSNEALKEFEFSVKFSGKEMMDFGLPVENVDAKFQLEGIIDCAFLEDKQFVIVDYKLGDLKNDLLKLKTYKKQILLYKYALQKKTKVKVKECILYSFSTDKSVIF